MLKPKYNYYIGKELVPDTIRAGASINLNGENIDSVSTDYASDYIAIDSQYLHLSKVIHFFNATIHYYDENKVHLGYNYFADLKNPAIQLDSKTKYIAFDFSSAFEENKSTFVASYLEGNAGFIYSVHQINPRFKELSKKYTKENSQIFFRESLEGKITLDGKDFTTFNNFTIADNLIFVISKLSTKTGVYELYYRGSLNKTDCIIDYSKRQCELKQVALDDYITLLNKYDNTYNLIELAPEISRICLHKRALIQAYILGANTVSNFVGGTYWESEVSEAIEDKNLLMYTYQFAYVTTVNEIYIERYGAAEEDLLINGIYTGLSGSEGKWYNTNGYILELVKSDLDSTLFCLRIIRESDGTVVKHCFQFDGFTIEDENDKYLSSNAEGYSFADDAEGVRSGTHVKTIFTYPVYTRILCDVDSVIDSSGEQNTVNLPSDDFAADSRNFKKVIGLKKIDVHVTTKTVSEPTKFGMTDDGTYFTDKFLSYTSGFDKPLPICRSAWTNASIWFTYNNFYGLAEQNLRKKYTLKDCFSIAAVIKVLLREIDPSLSHEATAEYSQFLYSDTMPIANSNLVRSYIYLTQKSNVLKGDYDQAAQKAEISLEDIMKMLRDCFRCYWYIEDSKFKIEHISYFNNGHSYTTAANSQIDLTVIKDAFNKKVLSYFQSSIEFEKSELNARYEFGWADDVTELFGSVTADVKDNYVQKDKTEEITISNFSSDIDLMLFNPSNFSNDGFALLCPLKNDDGTLEIPIVSKTGLIDANGNIYSAYIQNYYASWLYLLNFYVYDMPGKKVKVNVLGDLNILGLKRCMQNEVSIAMEEDPELFETVNTVFGKGVIDEVVINLLTRLTKINLLYKPK